jgi:membrane fusion protein, multidrug efflux system
MKKGKWIIIGVVSLGALIGGGAIFFSWWSTWVYTNDANIEAFSVNLSSEVLERIVALHVDEGDHVKQNELIAEMQPNILLSKKQEAEAKIVSLEKEVNFQEAHFEKIRNDYERAVLGIRDEIISSQEFDHKQKDYEMAKAGLELAFANLFLARMQLEVIDTELTHYYVYAPMDGYISKRWVLTGDVTQPGQTLFTMYDLKNVWVTANLSEKKLKNVRVGDPVDIHVDAYPGYTFKGKIFVIKGAAASQFSLIPQNNATGNYTKVAQRIPIKITIDPPEDFPHDEPIYLFPGMSVEVTIRVKKKWLL